MRKFSVGNVAADFDGAAGSYEENRLAPWYKAQGKLILEAARPVEHGVVLDVGCGTGWLLRRILRNRPGLTGVGVDVSGGMVQSARVRASADGVENVLFVHHDWEDPAVADALGPGAPTLAVCVSAFHYFRDPLGAVRRVHRLLAPGGRFLLLDRATDGAPLTAAWDLLHRYVIRDGCRFYRTDELVGMLRAAGFVEVRVRARIREYFRHGKALTSLVLVSGVTPPATMSTPSGDGE